MTGASALPADRLTADVAIIGSGFGGAISALRAAKAGRRVVVLERGRRYAPEDFPRDPFDGRRVLWRGTGRTGWRGIYDLRFLSGIATLTASGVGGGSLVYANILVRPDARIFDERWPAGTDLETLAPYYARVEATIRPEPLPDTVELAKERALRDAVAAMGRASDLFRPPASVDWTSDHGCRLLAQCEFGCPVGAKRSIDRTYLHEAQALGVTLRPDTRARTVEPRAGGGYRVHATDVVTGQAVRVDAPVVVVAAGTLGTAELLLRSRDEFRTLPRLHGRLGHGFSGNGDFIGVIRGSRADLEPEIGPDVTSVLKSFEASSPGVTVATPTYTRPVMAVLARTARPDPDRPVAPWLWPLLGSLVPRLIDGGPVARLLRAPLAALGEEPDPAAVERDPGLDPGRATAVFAIGRDNANGRLVLRPGRRSTHLDVTWAYEAENRALVAHQQGLLRALAAAYGGEVSSSPTWTLANRILTVHPLGGCSIASPGDGVAEPDGAVTGYPGLFIADGSLVPSSIGFHPALTIAALAERVAERVAAGP